VLFDLPPSETTETSASAAYQVLARRYRPQKFSEVIGQDVFVRVLQNAISENQIAHGILLSGIRGIGKTTFARLIAKSVLCEQGKKDPCTICSSCQAIQQDAHVDVLEVDAASRTGVEDMRTMIEGAIYRPVMGRFKVYIIDEVHMLSKNAFNALLKTLEEPPQHVKFILATTEVHKVPATVLSRCQQFALKPVAPQVLLNYLEDILEKEGFSCDPQALSCIVSHAEGSVRSALSMLDQALLLSSEKTLTALEIQRMLGLPDELILKNLFQSILKGQGEIALEQLTQLFEGASHPFEILEHLLILCHQTALKDLKSSEYLRLWHILSAGMKEMKESPLPLLTLEMIVIRAAHMSMFPLPENLLKSFQRPLDPPASPDRKLSEIESEKKKSSFDVLGEKPHKTFEHFLEFIKKSREGLLYSYLSQNVFPETFSAEKVVLVGLNSDSVPHFLEGKLQEALNLFFEVFVPIFWEIKKNDEDQKSLSFQAHQVEEAKKHPLFHKTLSFFPDAVLEGIEPL
jgi:DNA polymerase III subunit gamma/tau